MLASTVALKICSTPQKGEMKLGSVPSQVYDLVYHTL